MQTDDISNNENGSSCGPAVVHGLVYSSNSDNRLPTVCMFEWEPEDDDDCCMISSVCTKDSSGDRDHDSIVKASSEDHAEVSSRKCHEQLADESKSHFTFPLLDCFFDLPCCARY